MPIPEGVQPNKVPPPDLLDRLTEAELFDLINYQQTESYVAVGAQFWIDELSRRRTERVLTRIADASAESAERANDLARLTVKAAKENERTTSLNQERRNLTRVTTWLAAASFAVAVAALVATVAD